MYIQKSISVNLTDEERKILDQAREILMTFENDSSPKDGNLLQDLYDDYVGYTAHEEVALTTAIDLLTTVLGDMNE